MFPHRVLGKLNEMMHVKSLCSTWHILSIQSILTEKLTCLKVEISLEPNSLLLAFRGYQYVLENLVIEY